MPAKIIDPTQGYFNPGELVNAPPERAAGRSYLARALQIVTVLQTSLEAEKVIELFSREMAVTIPHDSISYTNNTHRIALTLGKTSEHRCSYRLVVTGKLVGQVSLTRATPFDGDEIEELEYLLCSLVYPMLNALKYRDALDSALRDPLTKLSNRAMLDVSLKREIDLARRHKTPLSLVVIDVDDFKQVNDTYGHAVGDEVLKCVATCIAK
ncbi:MAG: GGDEF domain-containing protein, partial [Gammaproteobacteria bacterium]|nr:GGDEF domain-containing protein [Gammaproteobacteria bacterium]